MTIKPSLLILFVFVSLVTGQTVTEKINEMIENIVGGEKSKNKDNQFLMNSFNDDGDIGWDDDGDVGWDDDNDNDNAPISVPTLIESSSKSAPTQAPNSQPLSSTSGSGTKASSVQAHCTLEKYTQQLRLYWEEGMSWQETSEEFFWCAECEDDCDEDEKVQIRRCEDDEEKQEFIFYNCTIRPKRDEDLCFTANNNGLSGAIKLRPCDLENLENRQLLKLFEPTQVFQKFQIKPFENEELCLTQEHHPRNREELKFSSCKVAYNNDPGVNDDTSHWIIGTFND